MRVAIIGGGAAGLCAARHLSQSDRVVPHVFEQSASIGGTWVFTPTIGTDARGEPVHSSMYKQLRTNLPKEIMAFPDFPFGSNTAQSFVHHTQVLQYLENYALHFKLHNYIQFSTKIESIAPEEEGGRWMVKYRCLLTNTSYNDLFDGVMVCNGHYSKPYQPSISGIEKYTGKLLHSHDYRDSEDFRGENVIVLGAGASGTDIAVELSSVVNQVYLSHNGPLHPSKFPRNVAQVRGIESCIGGFGFLLTDGSRVQCDTLIVATGYEYTFPFLSPQCGIIVEKNQVQPLYKHFLNIEHPTMALIGVPFQICPFPIFDRQIQLYKKILLGEVKLLDKKALYEDTAQEKDWRINTLGMREKDFHKMGDLQWEYVDKLSCLAGVQPLDTVIQKLYSEVWRRRRQDLTTYKEDLFRIIDPQTFVDRAEDTDHSSKYENQNTLS